MMSLNASQSYLLIGHVKEGGGGDHFRVSCHGTWRAGISPPKCIICINYYTLGRNSYKIFHQFFLF